MAEKKTTTKKAAATKAAEPKKETVKKAAAPKKAAIVLNAENVGFKAGDVYQALAAAGKALTVKEIAKAAKISEEETLLGMGWLFKQGKIVDAEAKITLA
jgi:hypothetical protein